MKNHIHVIAVFLTSFNVIPSQHRQGTLQWFSTKAYNHENQLTKLSMKAKRINETQKRRVNLNFTRLLCLVSDKNKKERKSNSEKILKSYLYEIHLLHSCGTKKLLKTFLLSPAYRSKKLFKQPQRR